MRKIHAVVLSALVLAGCDSDEKKKLSEVNCGDEVAKSALRDLLMDELERQVKKELQASVEQQALQWDAAKFRALASSLSIDFVSVRTSKKDPNSTKRFCEAEMKVVVPPDMATTADKVRRYFGYQNLLSHASALDIRYEAGTATDGIEYSAQPTDDGTAVYVTTATQSKQLSFATAIIAANMVKPLVDAAETKKVKEQEDAQARQAVLEQQRKELENDQSRLKLEQAQAGIKQANDEINVVWNAATAEFRKLMLPEQRIWLKEREVDCKTKASAAGEDVSATDREVLRLDCETELTKLRTIYLKAKASTD